MTVLTQSREDGEQLGSAVLLAGFDDLMVSEYVLEPGTEPGDSHYHANHTDSFYVLEGELVSRSMGGPSVRRPAPSSLLPAGPCTRSRSRSARPPGS